MIFTLIVCPAHVTAQKAKNTPNAAKSLQRELNMLTVPFKIFQYSRAYP
jgi:hypothetical protein